MSPRSLAVTVPDISIELGTQQSDLPSGWAWAQLGEIVTHRNEKLQPDRSSALPFKGMDDVPPGSLRATSHGWFRDMKSAANAATPGDILYGRLRPYLNKVALAESSAAVSGEFIVLQPRAGIEARYAQFALHSRKFINFTARGTSGERPRIDFDKISKFTVPIPPNGEQRRIVERIDELFAEIAEGEAALERTRHGFDTWRRALLKAAVTGELTRDWREANRPAETHSLPVDIFGPYAIPTGWIWTTVGAAGQVLLGRQRAPQHHSGSNMRPYLRVANVLEDRFDFSDVKFMNFTPSEFQKYNLQPGDILLNEGQSLDLVGRPAIYRGEVEECCFQKTLLRFRAAPKTLSSEYAQIVLLYYLHSKRFRRAAPITTNMAHLTLERLLPIEFPLPPREEQTVIVRRYQDMRDMIDDLVPALEDKERNALRQAILKAAFEGLLVPQEPADEPASALLARLRKGHPENGVRRRRGRAAADFSHPSLPGLSRQSADPRVEPAGDE